MILATDLRCSTRHTETHLCWPRALDGQTVTRCPRLAQAPSESVPRSTRVGVPRCTDTLGPTGEVGLGLQHEHLCAHMGVGWYRVALVPWASGPRPRRHGEPSPHRERRLCERAIRRSTSLRPGPRLEGIALGPLDASFQFSVAGEPMQVAARTKGGPYQGLARRRS